MSLRGIFESNTRKQNGHWQSGGNNKSLPPWKKWHTRKRKWWNELNGVAIVEDTYTTIAVPMGVSPYGDILHKERYSPLNNSYFGVCVDENFPHIIENNPQRISHLGEIPQKITKYVNGDELNFYYYESDLDWWYCIENSYGIQMISCLYLPKNAPVIFLNTDVAEVTRENYRTDMQHFDVTYLSGHYPLPTDRPNIRLNAYYNENMNIGASDIPAIGCKRIPDAWVMIDYHCSPRYKYIRFICPNEDIRVFTVFARPMMMYVEISNLAGVNGNHFDYGSYSSQYEGMGNPLYFDWVTGCGEFPVFNPDGNSIEWDENINKYGTDYIVRY